MESEKKKGDKKEKKRWEKREKQKKRVGNSSAAKMKVKNIQDFNLGESKEAEFQSHIKLCV